MFNNSYLKTLLVFNRFDHVSKLASLKRGSRALRSEFRYPTQINWYPGHMDKAIKRLKQDFTIYKCYNGGQEMLEFQLLLDIHNLII